MAVGAAGHAVGPLPDLDAVVLVVDDLVVDVAGSVVGVAAIQA